MCTPRAFRAEAANEPAIFGAETEGERMDEDLALHTFGLPMALVFSAFLVFWRLGGDSNVGMEY